MDPVEEFKNNPVMIALSFIVTVACGVGFFLAMVLFWSGVFNGVWW